MRARRRVTASVFTTLASVLLLGSALIAPSVVNAAASKGGTEVATSAGPFGTMLVVGSGKYAGYTLYYITSDVPQAFGCTTVVMNIGGQPGSCTGPSDDQKAEWPALTTTGAPTAGAGVDAKLLGTVERKGIGEQVTYAGHPLYLFDTGPGQVTGEGWDEPGMPPWHGVWWLMAPTGVALSWPGSLGTDTIAGKSVLGAIMFTGGGFKTIPVYSFSGDTATSSSCTGACAVAWPPVLTSSVPGKTSVVDGSKIGTLKRPDGTYQITYGGKPLYLYGHETPKVTSAGVHEIVGNGNGLKADGGTFALVTP